MKIAIAVILVLVGKDFFVMKLSEHVTFWYYRTCEQRMLRRASANAQTRLSIFCSHVQRRDVDDKKVKLKFNFTSLV